MDNIFGKLCFGSLCRTILYFVRGISIEAALKFFIKFSVDGFDPRAVCFTAEVFVLMWINWFCTHSEQVLPSIHTNPDYPCELVGTWNTWYGEQDQAGVDEFTFSKSSTSYSVLFFLRRSNSQELRIDLFIKDIIYHHLFIPLSW